MRHIHDRQPDRALRAGAGAHQPYRCVPHVPADWAGTHQARFARAHFRSAKQTELDVPTEWVVVPLHLAIQRPALALGTTTAKNIPGSAARLGTSLQEPARSEERRVGKECR